MDDLLKKLWPYSKSSSIVAVVLIVLTVFVSENVIVLGLCLLSAWLFSPIVLYWLIGDHDLPISFMINIFPMLLRKYVAYGWFVSLLILSFVWVNLAISANIG